MDIHSRKKLRNFMIIYGSVLFLFVGYVLLDTFIIPRTYSTADVTNSNYTQKKQVNSDTTKTSYTSENIHITLTTYREYNTNIHVADIQLNDVNCLKTALASNMYGRNLKQKTSEIAEANHAILAINGDFYGAQRDGYVLRNGTLYRDSIRNLTQEDLLIDNAGNFSIMTENDISNMNLELNDISQIFSFGPGLVVNNEIAVSENDEVSKAMASNPRTAIAQINSLHYLFVVSDGRTEDSEGVSLYQLALFLKKLGAANAYNLDGGGSSTMYFNGNIVNYPTTNGRELHERRVSDIVYITE